MIRGIRIDVEGTFSTFNFTPLEMIERILDRHTRTRGEGDYTLIDEYHEDRVSYMVYGWLRGSVVNQFDIDSCNAFGDMIVIGIDEEFVPIDIYIEDLITVFTSIDLDDFLIGDELVIDGVGYYDNVD